MHFTHLVMGTQGFVNKPNLVRSQADLNYNFTPAILRYKTKTICLGLMADQVALTVKPVIPSE